jgi:hypothetical protein
MPNTPFQPPTGLVSDDTTYAMPGRWANGSMARWYGDSWQVRAGWERMILDNLGGVCRSVLPFTDTANDLNIGFGCHNALKAWRDSVLYDITPTGFVAGAVDGTGGAGYGTGTYGTGTYGSPSNVAYFPLTWSLGTWGGFLVANPRGQGIYIWDTTTSAATLIANAPAEVTYMLSTPQRQVMALGCNDETTGVFNPLLIRWSDIEDYTDWTTLSSNNAGDWALESGGRIVCGRVIGDYVFVWTADGVFVGTYVGAPGQTWKFERMGMNCGSISPGAPVVASQNVAWVAPDKTFWQMTLGGEPAPLGCDIRQMFVDHVTQGQDDKIISTTCATYGELAWFWPDDRDGFEVSRSISVGPGGWARDMLPRSAYCDSGPQPYPIGVAPTGEIYWQEKGNSADGQALTGFLESSDFFLGEAEGEMLVGCVWPDFKGQIGNINMTLFTRRFPQSVQRAHGPWSLAPGQSLRSFRASGRIGRVRFDWSSAPAYARGGRPEFDIRAIGGR